MRRWLPIPLRVPLVWLLVPSALFKFLDYPLSVGYFAGLGIPAPGVMVAVVVSFEAAVLVVDTSTAGVAPFKGIF